MNRAVIVACALAFGGTAIEADAKPRATKRAKKKVRAKKPRPVPIATEPVVIVEPLVPEQVVAKPTEPLAADPPMETEVTVDPASEVHASVSAPSRAPRFRISIDDGPIQRRLRYVDDWKTDGQTVRDYDLVANAIGVSVSVRPLSSLPAEVYVRGELVVGVSGSQGPDAEVYSTRSSELQLGVLFGGYLGPVRTAVSLAGGQHQFEIADEMSERGELVPDTRYRYTRLGGIAGVPLGGRVQVIGDVGYRMLMTSGSLASEAWFPWASGDGVDASLGVEVRVTTMLNAYMRGSVRRYFFAMNPEPGDALVVGGAIDQYLGVAAGLSLAIH